MAQQIDPPISVRFASGDGTCAGDLWLPTGAGAGTPVSCVVLGHGLGGTRAMGLAAFAERFVAAGHAALTFDYRHWGDSTGEPRDLLVVRTREADFAAALRFAQSHPAIDGSRVVAWGTSLGGGHVLGVLSRNPGFAAGIAQCPFTDGPASALTLGPVSTIKVSTRAIADLAGALVGRRPVSVRTAGQAGDAALMTAPDAAPGYERLMALDPAAPDGMAARAGLAIPLYRPGARMRRIDVPTLILVSEHDTVAPTGTTRRQIKRAKNANLAERTYPFGHFDFYFGDHFESAITDQLAFLERTVGTASR